MLGRDKNSRCNRRRAEMSMLLKMNANMSAGVIAAPFIHIDSDSLTPPIAQVAIPAIGLTL